MLNLGVTFSHSSVTQFCISKDWCKGEHYMLGNLPCYCLHSHIVNYHFVVLPICFNLIWALCCNNTTLPLHFKMKLNNVCVRMFSCNFFYRWNHDRLLPSILHLYSMACSLILFYLLKLSRLEAVICDRFHKLTLNGCMILCQNICGNIDF